MIDNILLSEIKKRKEKLLSEIKSKEKELIEYEAQKELLKDIDDELNNYQQRWNELQNLELDRYDYIIALEDGTYEAVSSNDIDIVTDKSLIQKAYKYPISIADMMKLAEITNDEILEWVNKSRIPGKIYKELAESNKPLPRSLYVDQKHGKFILQCHIRGIEPEKYDAFQNKKIELWETFVANSIHIDFRITYPNLEQMAQFVITGEDVQEMVAMLKGEKRETANGIMNVQHSLCVSKPSGEPPVGSPEKYYEKVNPESSKPSEFSPSIDEEGAKIIQSLDLGDPYKEERSFWMSPGTVGATKNTYSYMALICIGDVITGCERHDLHELFIYPDEAKDEIFNGKFTIKCLKDEGSDARWEIWKAISNPIAMDSIMHSDIGYHYLVPASAVDGFGREFYREDSQSKFKAKLS